MTIGPVVDVYPLSPAQQGMLLHTLWAPGTGIGLRQLCCTLHGDLDVAAFARAWQRAADRHTVLRTGFAWEDLAEPLQQVHATATVPLLELDWSALSPGQRRRCLEGYLADDRGRGFALDRAPLMRLLLARCAEREHLLVWTHHCLLLDGWSLPRLAGEVLAAYAAGRAGREAALPPVRPFRDHVERLGRQDLAGAERCWRAELRGFTAATPLTAALRRGAAGRASGHGRLASALAGDRTAALGELATRHRLALSTLVEGAWALLLARYTGEQDVVFGAVSAGPPAGRAPAESMQGVFAHTFPRRVRVADGQGVLAWLSGLQADRERFSGCAAAPLRQMREWSEVPRGLPLFETVVAVEDPPLAAALREQPGSLRIGEVRCEETTGYPLALTAVPGRELMLRLVYDRRLCDDGPARRLLGHLCNLLAALPRQAAADLATLSPLGEADRQLLLAEWNDTAGPCPGAACLHELLARQAESAPDAVALECGGVELSYRELERRANRLAHRLAALGAARDGAVAVALERSAELVIALVAVLKAGGAYLPLDLASPAERRRMMATDSAARLLLTRERLAPRLADLGLTLVCLDAADEGLARPAETPPRLAGDPEQLAYVLFTSGSTGRPKGVMLSHGSVLNYLGWAIQAYEVAGGTGALLHTPLGFDLTVTSLWAPLLAGKRVRVLPEDLSVEALAEELVVEAGLSLLKLTPSHLEALCQILPAAAAGSARRLILGGEALPAAALSFWQQHAPAVRVINEYGPTEAAVGCCAYWLPPPPWSGEIVPIGRPIANVTLYLLDAGLQPVPLGARGELCVGGLGLARGYLGNPRATAEKFMPDPFAGRPGARLYRTGDLARHCEDGNLLFLGRADHQVKIRAFRIEPGEVEAALTAHPAVAEAAVLGRRDERGRVRLVAYLVPAGRAGPPGLRELRDFLLRRVPEYMVPAQFVLVAELPLTAHGKVDRARLPDPDPPEGAGSPPGAGRHPESAAPRTPLEAEVAGASAELLGFARVGIDDDFFALGGDSLLALRLTSRLGRICGVTVPLGALFAQPTVAGLAAFVEGLRPARGQTVEAPDLERLVAEVESLTEEEVELLLGAEQPAHGGAARGFQDDGEK